MDERRDSNGFTSFCVVLCIYDPNWVNKRDELESSRVLLLENGIYTVYAKRNSTMDDGCDRLRVRRRRRRLYVHWKAKQKPFKNTAFPQSWYGSPLLLMLGNNNIFIDFLDWKKIYIYYTIRYAKMANTPPRAKIIYLFFSRGQSTTCCDAIRCCGGVNEEAATRSSSRARVHDWEIGGNVSILTIGKLSW